MRRRLIWVGGSVAVLVAVFVALTFTSGRERLTFDFLAGHSPMRPSATDLEEARRIGGVLSPYSFKADAAAFRERATAELASRGFSELSEYRMDFTSGYVLWFARGDIAALKTNRQKMPEVQTVVIASNARYDPLGTKRSDGLTPANGWVSVLVGEKQEATMFDRFRDWIGL